MVIGEICFSKLEFWIKGLDIFPPFPWYHPDSPGSCPPDTQARKKGTDDRNDKNRDIASYLVIKKTGKPYTKGPSYPYKDYEYPKDTSIALPLKKIRCDERRESRLNSISHTEEDSVKVREIRGRQ
jgi:hypothetical protein